MSSLKRGTSPKAPEEVILEEISQDGRGSVNQAPLVRGENTLQEVFDSTTSEAPDNQTRIQVISFHQMVEILGNELFKEGQHDGGLGLTGEYAVALARNHVANLRGRVEEKYQSILARLHVRQKRVNEIKQRAKERFEQHDKFLNEGFENKHKYSLLIGVMYLLIAVFLILADIPLALKLTQEGFDLNYAMDEEAEISRLFVNTILVLQQNWEVFILAAGIALCTIFIKSLYDEYVSPSPAKLLPYKRAGLSEDEYERNRHHVDKVLKRRDNLKLGILAFLLFTIFTLGIFRAFHTPTLEDASGAKVLISGLTFILITLIFPIIGGVIFSLGLESFSNFFRALSYRWSISRMQRSYDHAIKDSSEVSEDIEVVKTLLEWCQKEEFYKQYFNYFLSKYRHGYEYGYLMPDAYNNGQDPFARAEKLRNKKISRQVFSAIGRGDNPTLSRLDTLLASYPITGSLEPEDIVEDAPGEPSSEPNSNIHEPDSQDDPSDKN